MKFIEMLVAAWLSFISDMRASHPMKGASGLGLFIGIGMVILILMVGSFTGLFGQLFAVGDGFPAADCHLTSAPTLERGDSFSL